MYKEDKMSGVNYNIHMDAVQNLTVCNVAGEVFCISFDTKLGRETFSGTNKKQVVEKAALRIKRACNIH